MVYVLTLKDMQKIENNRKTGGYSPTLKEMQAWDKKLDRPSFKQRVIDPYTTPFEKGGTGRQFGGALANEVIDMANFLPGAVDYIKQHVVGGKKILPLIPHFKVKPGAAAFAGQVAGYIPAAISGEGLVAKGLEKLPKLIKGAQELSPFVKRVVTSTLGNIGAGAVTSPEGKRTAGAIAGGAGGALAGLTPEIAAGLHGNLRSTLIPSAAMKYLSKFSKEKPFETNGELTTDMIGKIGQRYVNELNKSAPIYTKIFNKLTDNKKFMGYGDLGNYNKHINSISGNEAYLVNKVVRPEGLETPDLKEQDKLKSIDPFDVHMAQSRLGKFERKFENKSASEASIYGRGRQALLKDLHAHLKKNKLLDEYKNVAKIFAKNAHEFINPLDDGSRNPAHNLINALDLSDLNEKGEVNLNLKSPLVENPDIDKIIADYTENTGKVGLKKLNILEKHLGGDEEAKGLAKDYTKYHLFKNSYDRDTKTVDPTKFLKTYDKLSYEQKDALFNPLQQESMQHLALAKNIAGDKRTPGALRSLHMLTNIALGGILSSHVGLGAGEKMAAFAAGASALPIAKSVGSRAASAFLPDTLEELSPYLRKQKIKSNGKKPRLASPFAGGVASTLATQGNQ